MLCKRRGAEVRGFLEMVSRVCGQCKRSHQTCQKEFDQLNKQIILYLTTNI